MYLHTLTMLIFTGTSLVYQTGINIDVCWESKLKTKITETKTKWNICRSDSINPTNKGKIVTIWTNYYWRMLLYGLTMWGMFFYRLTLGWMLIGTLTNRKTFLFEADIVKNVFE